MFPAVVGLSVSDRREKNEICNQYVNSMATCTDIEIIELDQSTATVDLAAKAHNVEPGQIAKTLSLKVKNDIILVVAKGDARLDNKS